MESPQLPNPTDAALPSLLWTALAGLERAHIDEGAGTGHIPNLDIWANLLRTLDSSGTNLRDLPALTRLSKRALRTRMLWAARHGLIEDCKIGDALVRLTKRGSEAATRWRLLQNLAEQKWRAKIGVGRADKIRDSLQQVVGKLPLEHPHYPASYGAADASITGGNGKDWKGVPRDAGDTVSHLPFSALLSEAIVAFAMDYEKSSPVAVSLAATVIRRIPDEGRPLRGLGPASGISALQRHGFVRIKGESIAVTASGQAVRDSYDQQVRAVETNWCYRFGSTSVHSLRGALQDLARDA